MGMVNSNIVDFKLIINAKCKCCKKKNPVVLISQYSYDDDDVSIVPLCAKCFRNELSTYTLENDCLLCNKNFDCNIQKSIFSRKEIQVFRRNFFS